MQDAQRRTWSWTQFAVGGVLRAAANFFALNPSSAILPVYLTKVGAIALICAVLAGRFGDTAWGWVVDLLAARP
jgi:hypothetical protein